MLICTRKERRRGATVVESAFVLMVFILLFFGLVEYCRFLFVRQIFENAAREGARYAVVHTNDKVTGDVQLVVYRALGNTHGHMRNHSDVNNAFTYNLTATSDIRVYLCNGANTPLYRDDSASGAVTTYTLGAPWPANDPFTANQARTMDNTWHRADWTNASFGDLIAVQLVGKYRPILSNVLFMPNTIDLAFQSTMSSEAN